MNKSHENIQDESVGSIEKLNFIWNKKILMENKYKLILLKYIKIKNKI